MAKNDVFKTSDLFGRDLPKAENPRRTNYRLHFADMANMNIPDKAPDGAWHTEAWSSAREWNGGSMADALRMMREGWPEGAEQALKLRDGIVATVPLRAKLVRYDVAGAVPNVARAIAGNPVNMRRIVKRETAQRPVITLVTDICVSSSVPASALIAHAAAVAAAVDVLESGGFRCELIAVARTHVDKMSVEIAVKLKQADQALNLAVVSYGLGHPAFFRHLYFAIWGADPDFRPLGYGLGHVERTPPAPQRGSYTTPSAQRLNYHMKPADRFRAVMRELAEQGCPGIPEEMKQAA